MQGKSFRKTRSDKGRKRGKRLSTTSRAVNSGNVPSKQSNLSKSAFRAKRNVEKSMGGAAKIAGSAAASVSSAGKSAYKGAKTAGRAGYLGAKRDVQRTGRAFKKGVGAGIKRAAGTRTGRVGAAVGLIGAGAGVAAMVNNRRKRKRN